MDHLKTLGTVGTVAALLLALGLSAGPSHAASTVDVTYDISESSLFAIWYFKLIEKSNDFPANGTVSGTMKVRYTSDSSSGMPIQSGPASLRTFNLQVVDIDPYATATNGQTLDVGLTHTFNWTLTAPAAGSFTSGGALVGLSGNLLLTGRANCLGTNCAQEFQLPTQTVYPSFSYSGRFLLAGSAGPNSGTASTRHTLSGFGPISVPFGAVALVGSGWNLGATFGGTYAQEIVGREILREAEGHDPKVIPEPGTLLLLGAGASGLALVGRATRRPRQG